MSNDLRHHGIKGQKWGVRRYQKADGSLTPAGRKRYSDYEGGKDSPVRKTIPVGVRRRADGVLKSVNKLRYGDAKDYEELGKKVSKADDFVKKAKKYQEEKEHKEHEEKIKTNLSKMSDAELQKVVNRMNLEQRYTQVMRSREKELGESAAMKWLDAAGTVTTVVGSAISIAVAIKQLTSKSSKSDSALLDSLGDLLAEIERGK